jgi:hypothetical protein
VTKKSKILLNNIFGHFADKPIYQGQVGLIYNITLNIEWQQNEQKIRQFNF